MRWSQTNVPLFFLTDCLLFFSTVALLPSGKYDVSSVKQWKRAKDARGA